MARKVLAIALATVLFSAVSAMANRDAAVPESDGTPARVAQSGSEFGFGGVVASRPDVLRVSVNRPVEIPNHVLQPGNYDFRLTEDDNLVVVSTAAGKAIGVFPVIRASCGTVPKDIKFDVVELSGSAMMRLAAWYYPGDREGFAFVYPRAKHASTLTAQK